MQSGNTVPNRSEIKTGKLSPKSILEEMPNYEAHMRDKELEEAINGKEGVFRLGDITPEDFIKQEIEEKPDRRKYYGTTGPEPFFPKVVDRLGAWASRGESQMPAEVTDWQLERFKVRDDERGIFTVAAACGFGMAQHVATNEYGYKYANDEVKQQQETLFTEPVIALSPQTWAYRECWGGIDDAFEENVEAVDKYDNVVWEHHIYLLRPGLEDGGFMIQSGSSGSTIQAIKHGDTWDVELFSPVLSGGELYEGKYADIFHAAKDEYKNKDH